mgnify:CR=1 FL=1
MEENGASIKVTEYLKEVPTEKELERIIDKLGITPAELIRTGEVDWKENFKGKDLSNKELVQAMVNFPKLIERPIVLNGNKAIIGRPPEKVLEIL